MAEKCALCSAKIERTFLQKPIGTYIRDSKGKKKVICSSCQKEHGSALKEKL